MKRRTLFPADLMALLVMPVFVITAIGVIASYALPLFNWLLSHR